MVQCTLYYNMRYTSGATVAYHMFLCVVHHFSSTAFLCDTISMEEEFLHSPTLPDSPTWIAPDTQEHEACSSDKVCGILSDSDVIDLTTPAATKEETDYFQPAKGKP